MSTTKEKAHTLFTRPNFPEHAKNALASMLEDSKKGLFCDVNLVSGLDGKKIAAHRSVLSTVNDFFRTMFLSAFKEADDRNVTLSDISADILEAIICYCYTGMIEINEDNVQLLLPQAQLMLFSEIVEACSDFLQSLLNPTNCLNLFRYAKLYNCNNLLKNAKEYKHEHFLNIVVTQEFLQLSEEEVEEYLSDDKLTVNNEEEVFEALMRWVNHDEDARTSSLSKLLSVVRLQQLETRFLLEYIAKNSDNQSNLLAFAKGVKQNLSNAQTLPERIGSKGRLAIVYQTKMILYNPNTSVIESEHSFDENAFAPALVDEKIILVGQTEVRSFDLKTETWQHLPPLQTERYGHAVAVLNGHIYAIGGGNNTVERWDEKLNKWSYIANMQHKRDGACTAVLNGMLYVMGGKSVYNEFLSSVECYNPQTNKWNVCNSMLEQKLYAKAVVLNGEIYVFGGCTSSTTKSCIEKYNPETDTWIKISEMKERRSGLGACQFGSKIILFGGSNDKKWLTSMEEFDPATNTSNLIPTAISDYKFNVDIFAYHK